jgi:hypothetical protein
MIRRSLLTAVAAALAFAASQTAQALEFLHINFDNDTIGNAPTTGASTPVIPIPGALGGYWSGTVDPFGDSPPTANSGTILVGNAPSMTKAAVWNTNSANNEVGALYMDTGFSQASQLFYLSFDLNVLAAPAAATGQLKFLDNTATQVGILFGINVFNNGGPIRFAAAPTSSTGGVLSVRSADNTNLISFFDYTNGDTHNVRIDADYSSGTLNAYVDNNLELANFAFAAPNLTATTSEIFMFLNGESGYSNSIAIDNISASVPEPASVALLGVGALALIARRRKH